MAQENRFCDIREFLCTLQHMQQASFLCTLQHMQQASFHSQINPQKTDTILH